MTTLGLLVIMYSLYKGIWWYNNNTASNVAIAMPTAIGEYVTAINKRLYDAIHMYVG